MLSRMFETVRSGALLLRIIADAEMILCYSIRVDDSAVQVFGKIPILDSKYTRWHKRNSESFILWNIDEHRYVKVQLCTYTLRIQWSKHTSWPSWRSFSIDPLSCNIFILIEFSMLYYWNQLPCKCISWAGCFDEDDILLVSSLHWRLCYLYLYPGFALTKHGELGQYTTCLEINNSASEKLVEICKYWVKCYYIHVNV